jgi:hypothetical protein
MKKPAIILLCVLYSVRQAMYHRSSEILMHIRESGKVENHWPVELCGSRDSAWGFLKAPVYAVKIRDLHHLSQRIRDCCATVDRNMLSKIRTQTW